MGDDMLLPLPTRLEMVSRREEESPLRGLAQAATYSLLHAIYGRGANDRSCRFREQGTYRKKGGERRDMSFRASDPLENGAARYLCNQITPILSDDRGVHGR